MPIPGTGRAQLSWQSNEIEPKSAALRDLYYLKDKEQYPLKEWEEAVSYLLGCTVVFQSYEEITNSLKPFSLGLE